MSERQETPGWVTCRSDRAPPRLTHALAHLMMLQRSWWGGVKQAAPGVVARWQQRSRSMAVAVREARPPPTPVGPVKVSTQVAHAPSPALTHPWPPHLEEEVASSSGIPTIKTETTTLANGLRVISRDNHGRAASMGVFVKAGTMAEGDRHPIGTNLYSDEVGRRSPWCAW